MQKPGGWVGGGWVGVGEIYFRSQLRQMGFKIRSVSHQNQNIASRLPGQRTLNPFKPGGCVGGVGVYGSGVNILHYSQIKYFGKVSLFWYFGEEFLHFDKCF